MPKYFLYARKSTDVEDKQVLSIEAQLVELRALAKQNGLCIAEEFVEKRSAKLPDRQRAFDVSRVRHGERIRPAVEREHRAGLAAESPQRPLSECPTYRLPQRPAQ